MLKFDKEIMTHYHVRSFRDRRKFVDRVIVQYFDYERPADIYRKSFEFPANEKHSWSYMREQIPEVMAYKSGNRFEMF